MQNSLLRSGEKPLQVTVDIPDSVLTGSRYDVDLIVDQPLGRAMLAGGLVQLTADQLSDQIHPNVSLAPLARLDGSCGTRRRHATYAGLIPVYNICLGRFQLIFIDFRLIFGP